jgi:hypothetical protein
MEPIATISLLNGGKVTETYPHARIKTKGDRHLVFLSGDGDEIEAHCEYICKYEREGIVENVSQLAASVTKTGTELLVGLVTEPARIVLGSINRKH